MANLVKFEGTFKWARTKRLDKYGKWAVQFYPKDKEVSKAIKALGARVSLKVDESDDEPNGNYYAFSRRQKAKWGDLEAPFVRTVDGTDITENVGNGSKGFVVLDVYDYNGGVDAAGNHYDGGRAVRWEGLEITDLVVYNRPPSEDAPAPSKIEAPF